MPFLRILSSAEQVADYLRTGLLRGDWSDGMPGVNWLAANLGINHKTVGAALRLLEQEGLLASQGAGRKRLILPHVNKAARKGMRVGLLLWDKEDRYINYMIDLQHSLTEAGHTLIIPKKTLMDLKMDVKRIAEHIKETEVDAWIVSTGSQEVLQWFAQRTVPVFSIFGGCRNLPIAATATAYDAALIQATKNLIELGHRSIVLMIRRQHRLPEPGPSVIAFLNVLKASGIQASSYNLPDWDETVEGFHECLSALFKLTPPTALIVDESPQFVAVRHFLASRSFPVPQKVSLVCMESEPVIGWCVPTIAQIQLKFTGVVRHIMSWLNHISQGRKDVRQHIFYSEYVPGDSVGPVSKST
jgi:DNA-binding LacI/PurR family transcriptional regulator